MPPLVPLLTLAASPPEPVAVAVLSLDSVRLGQDRYARSLVDQAAQGASAREPALITVMSADLPDRQAEWCRENPLDRAAECVRFYTRRAARPAGAPPLVVVLVDDGGRNERTGWSEAAVRCIGTGERAADPAAQVIRIRPAAERMRGISDWMEDRAALAGCIAAAADEAG